MRKFYMLLSGCILGLSYLNAQNTFPTTGNAGIGTTSPTAPLTFSDTILRIKKIVLWDTALAKSPGTKNNNQFIGFGDSLGYLRYQAASTAGGHVFYAGTSTTASAELMRITGAGNVGIGTSTPAAKLDVEGKVKIADGSQGSGKLLTSDANGNASWQVATPSGWTVKGNYVFNTDSVGIGSTKPVAKLDILGDVKITDGTQGVGKVLTSDANGKASWQAQASSGWSVNGNYVFNNDSVGIGTSKPTAKLDVTADALINGATFGLGGGSNSNNVAAGTGVLFHNNSSGIYNTGVGGMALYSNTTGINNTAGGQESLELNTTGNQNTGFGAAALYKNTTGSFNTALGYSAAVSNKTGTFLTVVGASAGVNADGLTNSTALGNGATITASNQVVLGNSSVTSIGGKVGFTSTSDGRVKDNIKANVPGLAFINLLTPVTYNFNLAKERAVLGTAPSSDNTSDGIEKIKFTGLVAQDVDAAAQKIGYDFSGVDKTGKLLGLRYSDFVPPLIKAVQELSKSNSTKDSVINLQGQKITTLENAVSAMMQRLTNLEAAQAACCSNTNSKISAGVNQDITIDNATTPLLEQNQPNPFNQNTVIKYHLPAGIASAQMVITDLSGHTLKAISLSPNGDGQVTLAAGTLAQGNYFYSLLVDGRKIDSKQMVMIK